MLNSIENENRRLETERLKKLRELKADVLAAIMQLKPVAQIQNMTVQNFFGSIQNLKPLPDEVVSGMSENMNMLATKIFDLEEESRAISLEQLLLKSLWFRSMKVRQANVAEAHPQTFAWIFDDNPDASAPPITLHQWLQSQGGIYWIMGKAGSGKSTLMKFLFSHERTKLALENWSSQKKLVMASFFFWNAANTPSSMQKSQEGLLQSLLFEVLRQCPSMIRIVCSSKWVPYPSSSSEHQLWTRAELLDALDRLIRQQKVSARFCFFVDGLDEYDGDHLDLIKTLERFPISSDIKLCLSSRPWYVFKDAFGQNVDRTLVLEDLTKADIKHYIRDTLEKNPRFVRNKSKNQGYQDLVQDIAEKAQGVFLWVFLAVRSLLSGLTHADSIATLQKRLCRFPPTLEGYF
jgi:hypothetical protein